MGQPEPPDVYWEITVAGPVPSTTYNVIFLPGHTYRVRQRVYDEIQAQCATAQQVPDGVVV
jgi:hypothetical protein